MRPLPAYITAACRPVRALAATGFAERSQRVVLAGLPAGQYAYQLVVEGQLAAAPQKLIVTP